MSLDSPLQTIVAAMSFLVALVFLIVAQVNFEIARRRGSLSALSRQTMLVCVTLGLLFLDGTAFSLIPGRLHRGPPGFLVVLYVMADVLTFTAVALFAHLTHFLSIREEPPSRRWLALNYGAAIVMCLLAITLPILFPIDSQLRAWGEVVKWSYTLVMLGLTAGQVGRLAQAGAWRVGVMGVASRSDVGVLIAGGVTIGAMVVLHAFGSWATHRDALSLLGAIVGLIMSVPFAVRNLGAVIAGVVTSLGLLAGTGLVFLGSMHLAEVLAPYGIASLAILAGGLGLLLVFGPGQDALKNALDRVVFRGSHHRGEELRLAMRALSPELGATECCRRALAELNRVMGLDGAAVFFADGEVFAGRIDCAPIRHAWPRDPVARALIDRPLIGDDLSRLPLALRLALSDQDVLGMIPLQGSGGVRGYLIVRTDLLTTLYREEDALITVSFADQLTRLLDAAELLARAIEIERSLAHTEKLAAIGELAARIAHEIRNPITAARSLAQQLARESEPRFGEEHGVIVEELERVERQVADLLRYAKRDELVLERVDLAALVRDTVARFRARLDTAGVRVDVATPSELLVSADREKMRQVLINLIENSTDALAEHRDGPELAVEVTKENGRSVVRVSDNGPGVPSESLGRIFDPFFSLKPKGTGLGLAIVKRTIEAHGGRIHARSTPGVGISFSVELPDGAVG